MYIKNPETVTDNPSTRIYINKIGNRITCKIKARYYLKLLTPETMKLLDENGENVKITEVVLIHCNIVNNDSQQDSRFLHTIVSSKSSGQLLDVLPKNFIFLKSF